MIGMPAFFVSYNQAPAQVALTKGRRVIQFMWVLAGLQVLLAALFTFQAYMAHRAESSMFWMSLLLAVLFAALVGALVTWNVMMGRILVAGRRVPPQVALRFDHKGVAMWPLVGSEFSVPWAGVSSIIAGQRGIKVLLNEGVENVPGAIGLSNPEVRSNLKRMARPTDPGVDWSLVHPVEPAAFAAAVEQLSGGRVTLQRG